MELLFILKKKMIIYMFGIVASIYEESSHPLITFFV
jgi:hypothetical protein